MKEPLLELDSPRPLPSLGGHLRFTTGAVGMMLLGAVAWLTSHTGQPGHGLSGRAGASNTAQPGGPARARWPGLLQMSGAAGAGAVGPLAQPRIGTHSGTFHCDETLACWLLRHTARFRNAPVLRTRDETLLATLPVIVDVGSVYDPTTGRFDHHQKGFFETFSAEFHTKLSSAGLVYKHFGQEILASLTGLATGSSELQVLYRHIYLSFIEALDAIDNGINQFPGEGDALYISKTDLSARVGFLNPVWNEEADDDERLKRFQQAMSLVGQEFTAAVQRAHGSWLPARVLVKAAIAARFEASPSGQVVNLEQYTSWKEHIFLLEQELRLPRPLLYVVYPDSGGNFHLQAVSESPASFTSRAPLPAEWRGLRGEELDRLLASSVGPGCVFVHASGFIGGHTTRKGALAMARLAEKHHQQTNG
eukprot:g51554.t1